MQVHDPFLSQLMLDVKNLRVKHVRKMFVLLRELGTELQLAELSDKTDWSGFTEFNNKLQLLYVEHGLTLGEFAVGYVLNTQTRQRDSQKQEEEPTPKKNKKTTTASPTLLEQDTEKPKPKKRAQPAQDKKDQEDKKPPKKRQRIIKK